jgi:hypothetical protein
MTVLSLFTGLTVPDKQSIWDGEETAEDPDEDDDYLWFLF